MALVAVNVQDTADTMRSSRTMMPTADTRRVLAQSYSLTISRSYNASRASEEVGDAEEHRSMGNGHASLGAIR